ncbi:MAG: hypothetical protein ACKOAH_29480 [Pirellula sp.]
MPSQGMPIWVDSMPVLEHSKTKRRNENKKNKSPEYSESLRLVNLVCQVTRTSPNTCCLPERLQFLPLISEKFHKFRPPQVGSLSLRPWNNHFDQFRFTSIPRIARLPFRFRFFVVCLLEFQDSSENKIATSTPNRVSLAFRQMRIVRLEVVWMKELPNWL